MATLYTQQSKNIRKTWLLVGVFLAVILGLGYFLSMYYNDPSILIIAFVFSLVMNITSFWFSDKIALASAKAVPADEKEYLELHRIVENLAITAGLPKPRVYIIPDMAPNAFATGRNKEHAAVAVTTGLLQILDRSELEGVIAHELAHIGNRDILLQSMVVVLVGFISLISHFFTRSLMWGGGRDNDNRGSNVLAIVGVVLLILSPIIAQLIQLAISRKREFLADASGALLTRYPDGLASALKKISGAGMSMKSANDATAHLYISNPFGSKKMNGLHKLFMTHPPVEDRVKALTGMSIN
ncbi:MAG: M48 family metallopeptidase [Candidatus Pacebacteria bacterium]|nr:M48 family metallopeptidase [Candidatus Paceibacterota bacterium]